MSKNVQRMKCNLMCKYQKSNVSFSRWNCTGLEILFRISLSESSSILLEINMKGAYFDALTFDSSNANNSFLYIDALKNWTDFETIYYPRKISNPANADMVLNNINFLSFLNFVFLVIRFTQKACLVIWSLYKEHQHQSGRFLFLKTVLH